MLPILEISKGNALNESLDILKKLDSKNLLHWPLLDKLTYETETLLEKLSTPLYALCMPCWIWTPEFDDESRKYFQAKKEIKRGPFKNLVKNKEEYFKSLNEILTNDLENNLIPFYKSTTLSILDIMIASHLWGVYLVPEIQFSPKIHAYLQSVKKQTHFDYHRDFWT